MPYISKKDMAVFTSYIGIGPFIDPKPGSVFAVKEVAMLCGQLDFERASVGRFRRASRKDNRRRGEK